MIDLNSNQNVFVADPLIGAIRLITKFLGEMRILEYLGELYQAFSIHHKYKQRKVSPISEAGDIVKNVFTFLQQKSMAVKNLTGIEKDKNGREGTISNKTLKSLQLLSDGVRMVSEGVESLSNGVKVHPSSLLHNHKG